MARRVDISIGLSAAGVRLGRKKANQEIDAIIKRVAVLEKRLKTAGRAGRKAGSGIGSGMRTARRGALSLNRIVQDIPFGFIAISNNITELAASVATAQQDVVDSTGKVIQKGLTTGSAFKEILKQFKGPAGFLFIISAATALIVTFGSKILEAFNKGKTSAKELTEALDKLLTIQRDLNKFQISAEDIEAKLLRTRELIANQTQKTHKFTVLLAGATVSITDAEREALKIDLDRLNGIKALEKQLEKELDISKALAIEDEVLVAVAADLVEKEEKLTKSTKAATEALGQLLEVERDLKKVRITRVDVSASIARAEAEIARLQRIEFETSQLTKSEAKRLEGIQSLLTQLRNEEKLTGELAFQQELLVFLGGKVVESQDDHTSAIKEQITQLEKLQVELMGLRAISIDEAVAIQTATRDLQRQITARRSLVDLLAEQAEAQALLARAGVEVEPLEPRGLEKPLEPPTELVGTEGIDAQIEATERLIEIQRRRQEAAEAVRDAEIATAESAVLSAAAAVEAGDNVLQATLGVVRDIITARLAQAIAGAVASSSIFGPIAGAAAGALMAVLFNQLMPSGHKSSSGGTGAGAQAADTTSTLGVGLGGIRVQNRGFTIGATGAALSERAPMDLRIEVIEKDLFTINVLLKNADGVRAQVGSI